MIVECSRRPDGWIPVYGNEEEISDFLLEQDYYTKCSVKETKKGFDFWMDTKFCGEEYFNNREDYFVKLNDDGSITVSDGQPSFKDYVAMEFNKTDDFDWVSWLFDSPNVKSLHKNLITNSIEILCLPSTIFKIQEGSILIFNRDTEELYDVLDGSSRTIEDVLLNNGYVIFDKDKKEEDKT